MNTGPEKRPSIPVMLLSGAALVLLLLLVHNPFTGTPTSAPVWWVSLTAPQYPDAAFPDGIRIHFHVDGVFNGCRYVESQETYESERLNCKHEMDAINHYVGMYPIASGAPVERAFAPFVFSLLGLMIVAFALPGRLLRTGALAVGGIAIAVWMSLAIHTEGGVLLFSPNYLADMQGTMDLDREDIAEMTGFEAIQESYHEALGRYFPNPETMKMRAGIVATATWLVYGGLIAAIALLVVGVWRWRPFYWLLAGVPMLLPVFFVLDYAGWLWWFGHSLNEMGAFTVKPFMPTVFGDGKVAQFATHSYPNTGFGLMMGVAVLMAAAMVIRSRELKRGQ